MRRVFAGMARSPTFTGGNTGERGFKGVKDFSSSSETAAECAVTFAGVVIEDGGVVVPTNEALRRSSREPPRLVTGVSSLPTRFRVAGEMKEDFARETGSGDEARCNVKDLRMLESPSGKNEVDELARVHKSPSAFWSRVLGVDGRSVEPLREPGTADWPAVDPELATAATLFSTASSPSWSRFVS